MERKVEKLLLKPGEFAYAISASRSAAYALIRKGLVPSVRIGNHLRVPAEGLKKLIERSMSDGGREKE